MQPVVHVLTQGNLANRMVQHMVATRLAEAVPGCLISNVQLPDWGIDHPILPSTGGPEILIEGQEVDIDGLASAMLEGRLERVNLLAYGQWLANFPSRERSDQLFASNTSQFPGYGPDYLVCNVRGGEVLDGRHPHYTLVPPAFYAEIQARTGLQLVFMGQIEDTPYCRRLVELFPDATFQPSRGALTDFQTFRNSVNLVPAISTFSWLASWLSNAERIILPVSGLFHPVQMGEIDLLPLPDKRYQFYLFPINYSSRVESFETAHRAIDGRWRRMDPSAIAALRLPPRWAVGLEQMLLLFDESFYLATYTDIADALARGDLSSGRQHYITHGHAEGRRAFAFDRRWYASTYPMASFEVGQGDFKNLVQHYCGVGALRGYSPVPR